MQAWADLCNSLVSLQFGYFHCFNIEVAQEHSSTDAWATAGNSYLLAAAEQVGTID